VATLATLSGADTCCGCKVAALSLGLLFRDRGQAEPGSSVAALFVAVVQWCREGSVLGGDHMYTCEERV